MSLKPRKLSFLKVEVINYLYIRGCSKDDKTMGDNKVRQADDMSERRSINRPRKKGCAYMFVEY